MIEIITIVVGAVVLAAGLSLFITFTLGCIWASLGIWREIMKELADG